MNITVTRMKIKITREKMEKGFGSHSLVGLVANELGGISYAEIDLILSFEESSMHWREKNGGPHEFVITEYMVPCMMNDLLTLLRMFKSVSIEHDESLE